MDKNSLDGLVNQLDVHLLWYKWIKTHCPTTAEQKYYNKLNNKQQHIYLKEIMNEDNTNG
jgi:hypothetical protein